MSGFDKHTAFCVCILPPSHTNKTLPYDTFPVSKVSFPALTGTVHRSFSCSCERKPCRLEPEKNSSGAPLGAPIIFVFIRNGEKYERKPFRLQPERNRSTLLTMFHVDFWTFYRDRRVTCVYIFNSGRSFKKQELKSTH